MVVLGKTSKLKNKTLNHFNIVFLKKSYKTLKTIDFKCLLDMIKSPFFDCDDLSPNESAKILLKA